jgi:hypothetical protein
MKQIRFIFIFILSITFFEACLRVPIKLDQNYIVGKWTHYADSKTHGKISVAKEIPINPIYYEFKPDRSVNIKFSLNDKEIRTLEWIIEKNNHLLLIDGQDTVNYNGLLHRPYTFSLTRKDNDTTYHYIFKKNWSD